MDIYNIEKQKEGFWTIDEISEVSMFLFEGKNKALLIDTGYGLGRLDKIVNELTTLPLTVINTHGHPDHIMGNFLFEDVSISKFDKEVMHYFSSKEARKQYSYILKKNAIDQKYSDEWLNAPSKKANYIDNEETIDLGGKKLEIIAIPGHSAGSIAILDTQHRILIGGDTLISEPICLHYPDSQSLQIYLESLKKLKELGPFYDYIYPSHGKYPLEKSVIGKVMKCTEKILSGELTGKLVNLWMLDGIEYEYDGISILTKPPKD